MKDGKVDIVECNEFWTETFNNIEKDKDGKISSGEYNTYVTETFEELDGLGFITLQEYKIRWIRKDINKGKDQKKSASPTD